MEFEATVVFEGIWDAINARTASGERRYRYIILEGSSRSSKTTSLIDAFDLYAREYSNKRMTIWRDTKKDCKQTVLNDILKHLRFKKFWLKDFKYHITDSVLTYNTTSTIEIHGTDDDERVHGLTQDVAWFNEPYKISRDTFDQIDQRTSDFIVLDWNPKKSHFIDDLKKDKRAIVLHSTFLDNPFCPVEQRNKLLSYQPVSHCEAVTSGLKSAKQIFDGDIYDLEIDMLAEALRCIENHDKNSASAFKWEVYGLGLKAERPNRIFNWEPISPHDYNNIEGVKIVASDWGVVDPWAVLEGKLYDGALYLKQLNYKSENELRESMSIRELLEIQQDEDGLVKKHFQKLGVSPDQIIVCDTNRPNKIKALRASGYEYAIAAVKGKILDGIDLLLGMKVYYVSTSEDLKEEQENYSRKVDKYGVVLETPEDENNHLMDCARYIAEYLRQEGYITKV